MARRSAPSWDRCWREGAGSGAGATLMGDAQLAQHTAQVRAIDAGAPGCRREVALGGAHQLLEVRAVEVAQEICPGLAIAALRRLTVPRADSGRGTVSARHGFARHRNVGGQGARRQ